MKLTEEEQSFIQRYEQCPFCGSASFVEGPSGGLSQNIYCANDISCGARFNVTPMGFELIRETRMEDSLWYYKMNTAYQIKEPKYTPEEVVAKFTTRKRHWWQRGSR